MWLPLLADEVSGELVPAYSRSADASEMWVSLAEKAYAKALGNNCSFNLHVHLT
jgi:hypothetical protein